MSLPEASTTTPAPGDATPTALRGRLPGLDGLRGLAALAIVFHHSRELAGFPVVPWLRDVAYAIGHLAVPLFFVLSGFLITHLLKSEEDKTGQISLRDFYARRALRILPAAFFYLLVLAVLTPILALTVQAIDLMAAAFWFRNFLYGGMVAWAGDAAEGKYYTGHYWSLSVEEHFYMLWPLVLILLRRTRRLACLVGAMVVVAVWRAVNMKIYGIGGLNYWRTDVISDFLLAGAALGLAFHDRRWIPWLQRLQTAPWAVPLALAGIFGVAFREWFFARGLLANGLAVAERTVLALALALLIATVVQREKGSGPTAAVLNWRPLVWFGAISFSLYLWQQLFTGKEMPAPLQTFPQNVAFAIAAAAFSYYCIERPFIGLRGRFRQH